MPPIPAYVARKIQAGYKPTQHQGWIILHISGSAYNRGFTHGYFLRTQLETAFRKLPFLCETILKTTIETYYHISNTRILPIVQRDFAEWFEECTGIADGACAAGFNVTPADIIAWNSYESIYSVVVKHTRRCKCSAFIATGDATSTGEIVMSHNTHVDYVLGASQNVIMYIVPEKGAPFVMQTSPGLICSVTDWFISKSGMMGCETTISNVSYTPKFGAPYFCRIRSAMQYGTSIDSYIKIMSTDNAGDYACSWLFGDIHTGEIALAEIGLRESNILRTKNGIFFGMNSAIGDRLRTRETADLSQFDIKTVSGARKLRFEQLLRQEYYGKISAINAKRIIADHYDVFLRRTRRNQRSICQHTETPSESRVYPWGCVDGKTVDSTMAKRMTFFARWGSACGRKFDASAFIAAYPKFRHWSAVLVDLPATNWITVQTPNTKN